MKYDVETLEDDLLKICQAKLPAKLIEISAEKSDSVTIPAPTNSQYFNSTDDDSNISNHNFLLRYGVEDQNPNSISSATAEDNIYLFLVMMNEKNLKPGIARKKLFRYIRALKEVFNENFDRIPCASKISINTIAPKSFTENEISPVYKVGGVYIQTSIAG